MPPVCVQKYREGSTHTIPSKIGPGRAAYSSSFPPLFGRGSDRNEPTPPHTITREAKSPQDQSALSPGGGAPPLSLLFLSLCNTTNRVSSFLFLSVCVHCSINDIHRFHAVPLPPLLPRSLPSSWSSPLLSLAALLASSSLYYTLNLRTFILPGFSGAGASKSPVLERGQQGTGLGNKKIG